MHRLQHRPDDGPKPLIADAREQGADERGPGDNESNEEGGDLSASDDDELEGTMWMQQKSLA